MFKFACVVETWLKPNTHLALELPGYFSDTVFRCNQKGGSRKQLDSDGINASAVDMFTGSTDSNQCLTVCANVPNLGKVYLGVFIGILT